MPDNIILVDTSYTTFHRFFATMRWFSLAEAEIYKQHKDDPTYDWSLEPKFIEKYTKEGDVVYDPFGGRGTTAIEAALMGRNIIQNDINPISEILSSGRLVIPTLGEIEQRLKSIKIDLKLKSLIDLTMFYEKQTFIEFLSLRDL